MCHVIKLAKSKCLESNNEFTFDSIELCRVFRWQILRVHTLSCDESYNTLLYPHQRGNHPQKEVYWV